MMIPFYLSLTDFVLRLNRLAAISGFLLLFPFSTMANPPLMITDWLEDGRMRLSDARVITLAGIATMKPIPDAIKHEWSNKPVALDCIDENRYGDADCLVVANGALLQQALLDAALAMIYYHEPHPAFASFNESTFATSLDEVEVDQWAIVEGTIQDVTIRRDAAYLNFGDDWKTDFTIYIPKETMKQFNETTLPSLKDQTVQVRGWVHAYYGPRITVFNPDMMKVISRGQ